ncbi:MAG: zinc ribbon domain-containing protein [Lachnospiraceae bacterium]|nr:zinc ribbon domain-containing protein [Lachnospiraceae bacterium]
MALDQRVCEYCGTVIPPGATICPACEAKVPEAAPAPLEPDAPEGAPEERFIQLRPDTDAASAQDTGALDGAPVTRGYALVGSENEEGNASDFTYPDGDSLDKTMSVRHARPAGENGAGNAGNAAGAAAMAGGMVSNLSSLDGNALNETVSVRHAPPASADGKAGKGTQAGKAGNTPDIDSTMSVRHAAPQGGLGRNMGGAGYGNAGAQGYGNAAGQPGYGNAGQPVYGNAAGQPVYGNAAGQPGYGNAAGQSGSPYRQRTNVDSFTGASQGRYSNATMQKAQQIADEKHIRESEKGKKSKTGLIVFLVFVALIVFLITGFVKPGFLKSENGPDEDLTDTVNVSANNNEKPSANTANTENPDQFLLDGINDKKDDTAGNNGGKAESDKDADASAKDKTADEKTDTQTSGNYLSDFGIKITPQGEFTFKTMLVTKTEDIEEIEMPAIVRAYENTDGVRAGFKEVIFDCAYDTNSFTEQEGAGPYYWYTVFDRYTGTCLEFNDDVERIDDEGFVRLSGGEGGMDLDIKVEFENTYDDDYRYGRAIITCPEWYDGAVFQVGFNSRELHNVNASIAYEGRPYRMDEMPYFDTNGHEYKYFSVNDK